MADPQLILSQMYEKCKDDPGAASAFVERFGQDTFRQMKEVYDNGGKTEETITRQQFSNLTPKERADHIREGGRITE